MPSTNKKPPAEQVYCQDRAAWRTWLAAHHKQDQGIWLVYDKGAKRKLSNDDIVEEALCFGWIDSLPKSLDSKQAMIYVAPRKPKSNWSKKNRERAEHMIKSKHMRSAGMRTIDLAKKLGTWTALEDVQNSLIPPDLAAALKRNQPAAKNFANFPPSSKRIILEWILNAKKSETRQARIAETVKLAAKNIKANHYRQ